MKYHIVKSSGVGVSASHNQIGVDVSLFVPKRDLLYNCEMSIANVTFCIWFIVFIHISLNREMISLAVLNCMICLIWRY